MPRILYVDDEKSNLDVFKNAFFKDFEIFTADSGEKGLEILKNEDVDLIIADQRMPQMTGVEFLKKVLDLNPGPNRILITAYSDIDAIADAINKGQIFQYIKKPWKKDNIKPILTEAIELYFLKKENQRLTKELKKELAAKQDALLKAEESDRLKTAFLRNISHEVRTPLNAILGFSELIALKVDELDKEYVGNIRYNVSELVRLIDNIIELSDLQAGRGEVNYTVVDIPKVIEKVNGIAKDKLHNHNKEHIQFSTECSFMVDQTVFISDGTMITKVMSKLIDNAVKYTAEGHVNLYFENAENEALKIRLKDTGLGMNQDQLDAIFSAFYKIENKDKIFKGIGVGLTIVRLLCNLLGAEIKVESSLGKGTEFVLVLPNKK